MESDACVGLEGVVVDSLNPLEVMESGKNSHRSTILWTRRNAQVESGIRIPFGSVCGEFMD
jgi:hypothetical protein